MEEKLKNAFPRVAYALIALFAATIVINGYMVVLAVNNNHDLVSENYYEEAVFYDNHKQSLDLGEKLKLSLDVSCVNQECVIKASGEINGDLLSGQQINLYRPSNKNWDKKTLLEKKGMEFKTENIFLEKGAWIAVIKVPVASGMVEKSLRFFV